MRLSVVIAALDEAEDLVRSLAALQDMRARDVELVVADGGSRDLTAHMALPLCDALVHAPAEPGARFNAGADCANGDVLLFLEPHMRLPANADMLIASALRLTRRNWGLFPSPTGPQGWRGHIAAVLARLAGHGLPDQPLFVRRRTFENANGFEDNAAGVASLSVRLRKTSRPAIIGRDGVAPLAPRGLPRLVPFRA
jgi:glycosyltransferase involved in cell wall biosynthesis